MKYSTLISLLLFLLLAHVAVAESDTIVRYDNSKINSRTFSEEELKEMRNNPDFDYEKEDPETNSFLNNLIRFLFKKLYDHPNMVAFIRIMFYVFMVLVLAIAVIKLLGINPMKVFSRQQKHNKLNFEAGDENIHDLNLDQLINDAAESGNFRLAVRYFYMKVLKTLNNNHLINWKSGKTNADYLSEMERHPLHEQFRKLTFMYEYIWYGDFKISKPVYQEAKPDFVNIIEHLKSNQESR